MNLSQPTDTSKKVENTYVFSDFLLKLMWFTQNDLAQGLQTFLSEGQIR